MKKKKVRDARAKYEQGLPDGSMMDQLEEQQSLSSRGGYVQQVFNSCPVPFPPKDEYYGPSYVLLPGLVTNSIKSILLAFYNQGSE